MVTNIKSSTTEFLNNRWFLIVISTLILNFQFISQKGDLIYQKLSFSSLVAEILWRHTESVVKPAYSLSEEPFSSGTFDTFSNTTYQPFNAACFFQKIHQLQQSVSFENQRLTELILDNIFSLIYQYHYLSDEPTFNL